MLQRFLDPAVLAGISGLDLVAKTVVDGFIAGLHRSPDFGFSQEFAEYRAYSPGDDLRHVDWNVFARTERAYLKRYRGETNSLLTVLLDASNSMQYTSHAVTKMDYARFVAASLFSLAIHTQRDGAGLVVFDDEVPESEQKSLYERTLKRKRWFESTEAMFRNLENKPPFATWRRDMLRDYCEYGTRPPAGGGVELKCPPEIEAEFYARSREYAGLPLILKSRSPLLVIFGEKSDSPGNAIPDKIAAQQENGRVVTVAGASHFLPMEQPEEVIRMATEFFSEN